MSRKEQAEASKARLIEAGRECFSAYGYERTTVAEILRRAGMARGALYHYFPGGKRDLFSAVFDKINDEFHRRRDAVSDIASPLSRLRAGVGIFMSLCTEDDFARIALMDAPSLVPGQASRGSSYELLRTQLADAKSTGEVRDFDVDAMAMALYAAVRSAGEFVSNSSDRRGAAARASRAIDLLLEGLTRGE